MTYAQQLAWLAQRFKLSEDEIPLLDLQLHLVALQSGLFVRTAAARLIENVKEADRQNEEAQG